MKGDEMNYTVAQHMGGNASADAHSGKARTI